MAQRYRRLLELMELKCYAGTSPFYSRGDAAAKLGQAGRVIVHASLGRIGNSTSATADVSVWLYAADSSDSENWATVGNGPFASKNVTRSDLPYALRGVVDFPFGRFLRIKVQLGGSNPTVWMGLGAAIKPYEGAG